MIFEIFLFSSVNAAAAEVQDGPMAAIFTQKLDSFYATGTNKGHSVTWGKLDTQTNTKSAELMWNSNCDTSNPAGSVGIESAFRFGYGHYSARLKTPDCKREQPNAGLISGFFAYFEPNPSEDSNLNGINDISEIDFEFVCANPTQIHVTAHTDYGPLEGNKEGGWRTSRCVNMSNGNVFFTKHVIDYGGSKNLVSEPETVIGQSDYLSYEYNTYGFDYYRDRIDFWMKKGNSEKKIKLWNFVSETWIPNRSMHIICNLWWTKNWSPEEFNGDAFEKPNFNPKLNVEYIKYEPLSDEDDGGKSGAIIAAIVVPIIVVIAVIVAVVIFFVMRRNKSRQKSDQPEL